MWKGKKAIKQTDLEKLRIVEMEIMDIIHDLCMVHHISYYMVGGSAIGAKRHGGFIPWDDDIDIAMPRPDYEKFIELCGKGLLPDGYFLHHSSTDPAFTHAFAKVRKDNTHFPEPGYRKEEKHSGIFVDIFPLDFTKKPDSILHRLRGALIGLSQKLIRRKRDNTLPQAFFGKVVYLLAKSLSLRSIISVRDRLMAYHNQGDFYTSYASVYNYQRDTYPVGTFGRPTPGAFEDRVYLFPEKCEAYLERLYGDWRKLPPPEVRHWHCNGKIIFDTRKEQP